MSKYRTVIGERVKVKIENLKEYFAEEESGRDTDFLAGLWDCLEKLEENPFRWQYLNTQEEGIRRAIIPYPQTIVYYKVDGDSVYITNIFHSRADREME
ncbi:MAG: hypothetical protein KDD63_20050 [Bacteroidetes bacterium]|nr:hypothetical protein [Bacteroidota bacterium]